MNKKIIFITTLMLSGQAFSQISINTPSPKATYDINAKNTTGTSTNPEGLLIPRIDRERAQSMTGVETSTIVYIDDVTTGTATGTAININAVGYYSFNGIGWVRLNEANSLSSNIYNTNGTLTAHRTVTQGTQKLAFTSNTVNGFSVDGDTFSIDGLNHRVGMGTTTPNGELQLSNDIANRKIVLYETVNNNNEFYGLGNNLNLLRYQSSISTADHTFYSAINGSSSKELMRIRGNGNVGIGIIPTSKLEISSGLANTSGLKLANLNSSSQSDIGQPIGVDANGIVTRSPLFTNIYNANGTLSGDRIVSQEDKKLTFVSDAVNAFSVDATTFSVDTRNNRIGIGTTTPNALLQFGNTAGNRKMVLSELANNDHQYNGWGINPSTIRYRTASPTTDHVFYAGIDETSSKELMRIQGDGSVGIGKAADPAAILEVFATDKGFLPPRLTTAQRNAIAGATPGLMIYNTDINCMQFRIGTTWRDKCGKGIITNLDCLGVINTGTITEGITVGAGVTSAIPYSGGNGGEYAAQTITSTGVPGLTATIAAGAFANGNGTLTYTISGIALASGTAGFTVNIGGQTCTFTIDVAVNTAGYIASLDCAGATHTGALTNGTNVGAGVTSTISYTGGNGGTYPAQSVNSIGVTGLVATLASGSFNNGDGTLIYTITGRPNNAGTATFVINIGGQTCNITRTIGGIPSPNLGVTCDSTSFQIPYRNNGGSATGTVKGQSVTASFSNYTQVARLPADGYVRCGTQVTRAAGFNVGAPGSGVNPPTLAGAMKIRFNRNISNLKVTVNAIQIQQRIRYILRRGGVQVTPVLTLSPGGTCNTQFTHESSSGTIYPTGIGGGFVFNLGGVWFDEIEIITPSTPAYQAYPGATIYLSVAVSFGFCIGDVQ